MSLVLLQPASSHMRWLSRWKRRPIFHIDGISIDTVNEITVQYRKPSIEHLNLCFCDRRPFLPVSRQCVPRIIYWMNSARFPPFSMTATFGVTHEGRLNKGNHSGAAGAKRTRYRTREEKLQYCTPTMSIVPLLFMHSTHFSLVIGNVV